MDSFYQISSGLPVLAEEHALTIIHRRGVALHRGDRHRCESSGASGSAGRSRVESRSVEPSNNGIREMESNPADAEVVGRSETGSKAP